MSTLTTLSLRTAAGSGLPSVDVALHARPGATVADLARALGHHLDPDQPQLLVVPVEGGQPWPADRLLAECGLRTGDLLDVVSTPPSWLHRPGGTGRPRAVVRVVDGPDRGQRVHVRGGSLTVGRGHGCTLRLSDPMVSQRHARVVLGARPTVHDEGSAHGTLVAGERLVGGREVDWGTPVRLGRSTVVIDAGEVTGADPAVSVLRPPRFGEPLLEEVLEVPPAPTRPRPSPLPWALLALPMIMGLALFSRTRTAYALVYVLAWPVMGYLGWRQQRRAAEKQFAEEVAEWRTDVDALLTRIDDQATAQRTREHDDHPDAATVRARAASRDRRLWARAADRDGFLTARVGTGTVPALLRGEVREGGDRPTRREVAEQLAERATLDDMPVVVDLGAHALTALAGPASAVDALARSLLLRLAADHSPTDVGVAACLGRARSEHEAWLRWLPHAATRVGSVAPVAVGAAEATALLDHLASEEPQHARTVCLVDEDAGIPRRTVEAVAAAAGGRLHLLWLGAGADTVPAATGLLVDLDTGLVGRADRRGQVGLDRPDAVSLDHAWRAARLMTPYVDEAAVLPASSAVPAVVRLPEVSSDFEDLDDTTAVLRRWSQSSGLRAQIGLGVDGVVTVDLREDGPHALVAGTTGSGKSELLQSLICSLALNNPPSRISFLLVDYKGGAAFRECADLPHTVGYITDLTPALVARALTSLGAEIAGRERLLARWGVKDLVQLEREHPEVAPPSLLICVDEFAALTAEVPEFVDGVVNLAQRGRSLGMHVVLATQRPAGVVTGAIRANTDLRIALRVSSAEDSRDVVDSPEAARIPRTTPGRAWIRRTGHGTAELVQSAWTGAREPLAGTEQPVRVAAFGATAATAPGAAPGSPGAGPDGLRLDPRTDLERCVRTIGAAFARSGAAEPARPWLPALPGELVLDPAALEARPDPTGATLVLGRVDRPAAQSQPDLEVDLAAVGHLLVHGASGSGKTELLRTAVVAASLAGAADGAPAPYVYGIDHAGGGLGVLGLLPSVEAVVAGQRTGRVMRLVRLLERTADERADALARHGCTDLADLAREGHLLPRVVVVVDNLPALVEGLEGQGGVAAAHVEKLRAVLQVGRRVGIHVIATAPGRTGVPTALAATFGRRVVLRMTAPDDYVLLGVPGGVLDADTPAGGGLLEGALVQVATTGGSGTPVQAERLREVAARLAPRTAGRPAAPVPEMPTRLDHRLLPAPERSRVAVAVDADAVAPVVVDLLEGPVLIAGRSRSGRSSALAGLAELARRGSDAPHVVHEATPGAARAAVERWHRAGAEGSASWLLLLVDDAHLWDAGTGLDQAGTVDRDALLDLVGADRGRIALVCTTDTAAARQRGGPAGFVAQAGRARRGLLLQPEWADGEVLGVSVPTRTTEPLTGPGRGVWCEGGTARVAQLISAEEQP